MQNEKEINYELLKGMQEMQPWLIRASLDDVDFARLMSTMDIVLIRDNNKFSINNYDEAIGLITKGLQIYIPKDRSPLDKTCMFTFLWLRYVCLTNKHLYQSIISLCFDRNTILESTQDRIRYVKGRFVNLGLYGFQIDDAYYIIKSYMDTMYLVGEKLVDISAENLLDTNKKNKYIEDINSKFGDTEKVRSVMNCDEIAALAARDLFIRKKI